MGEQVPAHRAEPVSRGRGLLHRDREATGARRGLRVGIRPALPVGHGTDPLECEPAVRESHAAARKRGRIRWSWATSSRPPIASRMEWTSACRRSASLGKWDDWSSHKRAVAPHRPGHLRQGEAGRRPPDPPLQRRIPLGPDQRHAANTPSACKPSTSSKSRNLCQAQIGVYLCLARIASLSSVRSRW